MSRTEYMKQLAYLLQDVPDNEKEEALSWYEDYFDEAGPEKEQEVIQTLGSPERVAAIIKDGLNGGNDEAGEYTAIRTTVFVRTTKFRSRELGICMKIKMRITDIMKAGSRKRERGAGERFF